MVNVLMVVDCSRAVWMERVVALTASSRSSVELLPVDCFDLVLILVDSLDCFELVANRMQRRLVLKSYIIASGLCQ